MPAIVKKTTKKTTKSARLHPAQTPSGYLMTGLLMWLAGYLLLSLALESGNLLQWLGVFLAFIWGAIRMGEGFFKLSKRK